MKRAPFLMAWGLMAWGALLLLAAPAFAEPARFSIVVGNNARPADDPTLSALAFADDDAARYDQLFGRVSEGSWLLTVLDDASQRRYPKLAARALPPTLGRLRQVVSELSGRLEEAARAGRQTTVYIAFSGHGRFGADGEPELVFLDGGLSRRALFDEVLAPLHATRIHLVIDACNAGAMVGGRGPFDRSVSARTSTLTESDLTRILGTDQLDRFPHVGAVVAASAGQETHEWSAVESGVFTHELLSGLLGAADVNGDLVVEYSELEAFVSAANSRIDDPRARPAMRAIPPALDRRTPFFSSGWVSNGARLVGHAKGLGRIHLERPNGQRYADAHFDERVRFSLLLPANEAVFVRGAGFEVEVPATAGGIVELDALARRPIRFASRGSLDATFRRALFAAPYGPTYYRGFADSRALVPVPIDDRVLGASIERTEGWDRRDSALTLWLGGGAALIAASVATGLAISTKSAFDATTVEAEANRLSGRYDTLRIVAVASAAVAVIAGGTGTWLWVSFDSGPSPDDPNTEETSALVGVWGRF